MSVAGASAAAMIAHAIKASGAIVSVEPMDFLTLIERQSEPLVIKSSGGIFGPKYQYLTSYKGLAFHAKSKTHLDVPPHCEVIEARKIWIPG